MCIHVREIKKRCAISSNESAQSWKRGRQRETKKKKMKNYVYVVVLSSLPQIDLMVLLQEEGVVPCV